MRPISPTAPTSTRRKPGRKPAPCCEPTCSPCGTCCGRPGCLEPASPSPSACASPPWRRGSCWKAIIWRSSATGWSETNTYVFTINGFPYGSFHGTRVKERVFQPDWTERARLDYTKDLFRILAAIARPGTGASVSTLPGSHKTFRADEAIDPPQPDRTGGRGSKPWRWKPATTSTSAWNPNHSGISKTRRKRSAFFERLHADAPDSGIIRRRIGVNYDACHFALEYDDARASLDALTARRHPHFQDPSLQRAGLRSRATRRRSPRSVPSTSRTISIRFCSATGRPGSAASSICRIF